MSSDPGKGTARRIDVNVTTVTSMPTIGEDDGRTGPTAGDVLHRVLANAARTFLINDAGIIPGAGREPRAAAGDGHPSVSPSVTPPVSPPVPGAIVTLDGAPRRTTEMERLRQSRVACRRIRSNLRTFRLLVEPVWSTSLRAELAWYADCLGESRDLHVLHDTLAVSGPLLVDEADLRPVLAVLDRALDAAEARVDHARESDRYARLIGQVLLLWDGPLLTTKAGQPAETMLPQLLGRSWRDVRGAARNAKKSTTDDNLHKLRIRVKGFRYGCETAAVVEGAPARRTAKASERLQRRLGDLHDAVLSVAWLEAVAADHPELADTVERLVIVERAAAAKARKGWRPEMKEIDRRWRAWQG
jgi:CHAD domain-containing protein